MSISIAQSRQQLSSLITAAQLAPQVITKRNAPVAVLVSAEYFKRSEAAVKPVGNSFYSQLIALREAYAPTDNVGLEIKDTSKNKRNNNRQAAWTRANAFTEQD